MKLRARIGLLTIGLGCFATACSSNDSASESAAYYGRPGPNNNSPASVSPGRTTITNTAPPSSRSPSGSVANATQDASTNPFILASHDPLSTFAADVDTASYDLFRRDIQTGVLPEPRSVRLEEYVNYFYYNYPPPPEDSQVPFSISLAAGPKLSQRNTVLLRVGIQGIAATPRVQATTPANLVFLVDVSGSMAEPNKLTLVQEVLRQSLDLLAPTDTVSIVTYASGTQARLPPPR